MFLIPKKAAVVTGAAIGPEDDRRYLQGVHVSANNGALKLEATDGHRLYRVCLPKADAQADEFPNVAGFDRTKNGGTEILVDAAEFARALKPINVKSALPILHNAAATIEETKSQVNRLTLATTDLTTTAINTPATINEKFPNTAQVWPKFESDAVTVRFNARYLMEICKAVIDFEGEVKSKLARDSRPAMVDITIGHPKRPCLFEAVAADPDGDKFAAVLMPMRRDGK